jgi:SH3-like domain-containing protein
MKKWASIIFLSISFFVAKANANVFKDKTFFVSLRADKAYLRTGPGKEYPIKYIYQLRGLPLEVLGEYESWYNVKDKDGDEGWINQNLVTKKRKVIVINGTQILYSSNNSESRPLNRLEKNVIAKYKKCKKDWCKVEVQKRKGWIEKENIWGVK